MSSLKGEFIFLFWKRDQMKLETELGLTYMNLTRYLEKYRLNNRDFSLRSRLGHL